MTRSRFLAAIAIAGLASGCAGTSTRPEASSSPSAMWTASDSLLMAVLWMRSSAEYEASTRQAWAAARQNLDVALEDKSFSAAPEQTSNFSSLPPAVIVDVDETVLDNGPFEARMLRSGQVYNRPAWDAWVEEAAAEPVPGALEFAAYAAERGVTIFYVTNRDVSGEAATRRNLQQAGFPLYRSVDYLLTKNEKPDWGSDKSTRRAEVAKRFRVVMIAGDDFNDFVSGTDTDPQKRRHLAQKYANWWGSRWILLPNPVYGSWERAVNGFDADLSDEQIRRLRLEALD